MRRNGIREQMVTSSKAVWDLALRPCRSRWLHGLNCLVVWTLCVALLAVVISPAAMEYWAASWLINFDQVARGMKQSEVRKLLGAPSSVQTIPQSDPSTALPSASLPSASLRAGRAGAAGVASIWEYHRWSRLKVYYISFDRQGRVLSWYAQ